MIKYKLKCSDCEIAFDSWFASSTEFEKLKKKKLLICHICNSIKVDKTLMSPSVRNNKKDIKNMGIKNNDTLLIHSSMKAIGQVEGGAETVLDAFMEYLEKGLLILPTHSWNNINEKNNVFVWLVIGRNNKCSRTRI